MFPASRRFRREWMFTTHIVLPKHRRKQGNGERHDRRGKTDFTNDDRRSVHFAHGAHAAFNYGSRLTRLMRGQETADGLAKKQSSIPLRRMAWASGVALLSRLAAMLLAYGFYRVLNVGELSFADSFEQLWLHWDTRHYIGIAQDGYTAVGDRAGSGWCSFRCIRC